MFTGSPNWSLLQSRRWHLARTVSASVLLCGLILACTPKEHDLEVSIGSSGAVTFSGFLRPRAVRRDDSARIRQIIVCEVTTTGSECGHEHWRREADLSSISVNPDTELSDSVSYGAEVPGTVGVGTLRPIEPGRLYRVEAFVSGAGDYVFSAFFEVSAGPGTAEVVDDYEKLRKKWG